jgi:hypothetical protein
LRAKQKSGRESDEVRLRFKKRASINHHPRVTAYLTIDPLKPDDKRRIRTSSRQDVIEQQATLKAVAIG